MLDVARHGVAVALDVDEDDDGGFELAAREDLEEAFLALVFAGDKLDALLDRVSTASPTLPIVTMAGRRRYLRAMRSTALGIVAVYIIVWR